jgi:hypothetical protein
MEAVLTVCHIATSVSKQTRDGIFIKDIDVFE